MADEALKSLLQRIESLERRTRTLKGWISLLVVFVAAATFLGLSHQDAPKGTIRAYAVEAQKFILRDSEGQFRGGLFMEGDQEQTGTLAIADKSGTQRFKVSHNSKGEALLALYGAKSPRPAAAIGVSGDGDPAIRLEKPDTFESLRLDSSGSYLYSKDDLNVAIRRADENGKNSIMVFDKNGKEILLRLP